MRRVLGTVSVVGFAALLGGLCGRWVGERQVLFAEERILAHGADKGMSLYSAHSLEITSFLHAMNASDIPFCSEADLDRIGQMLFMSNLPKAAGRFRGGKIACVAGMGRESLSVFRGRPSVILNDGMKVYWNFLGAKLGGQPISALSIGDSFVVANPLGLDAIHAMAPHTAFTVEDEPTHTVRDAMGRTSPVLPPFTQTGIVRRHESLYAAHCNDVTHSCFIAYESYAEALHSQRALMTAYALAGALIGAMLSFFGVFLYQRNGSLEQQLLRAIRRDKLWVLYQPIVEIRTSRIVGAEALVRWSDESGASIPPDTFTAIAEESAFVGQITRLVLRHALRDFQLLFKEYPDFRLSINIAVADLVDPSFAAMLEAALVLHRLAPNNIALEITERATARQRSAEEGIKRLRQRGHKIYVDDFGTGYSSLSYLHELSLDTIKIDRAFTKAIGTEAVTHSILPLILTAAEKLKLSVVVEGVETRDQVEYLSGFQQGLFAQGWFYGRPCSAAELLQMLTVQGPGVVSEGALQQRSGQATGESS